ncbi:hypothetical protein QQ045_012678 [Rhodiola kirilowii]
MCVSTISYQVKVNDKISSLIKPGKGLRQGDPLSPYLFLFCTELLNVKLHQAVLRQRISGVQAGKEEVRSLKFILSQYENISGQRINFEKSEIWKKVQDWKSKLLSAAGREVLVKAVIQAIPVYMMSVYQFPKKVILDLSKLIQQFWWAKNGNRGISWLSQNTMQRKKCEGGLGFKDLSTFNEAILMKWGEW